MADILSFKTGHDPAACLLRDGKLVAAVEEERFTRVKHAPGALPLRAIEYCLDAGGIRADDVETFVYARERNLKTAFKVARYCLGRLPRNGAEIRHSWDMLKVQADGLVQSARGRAPYQRVMRALRAGDGRLVSYDHHLCHAASAYYGSGRSEAAVLVMDGKGEDASVTVWHGREGKLDIVDRLGFYDSLGYFYSAVTDLLGFQVNDGEYKVMGMAPYGRPSPIDDVLRVGEESVTLDTRFIVGGHASRALAARFPDLKKTYDGLSPPRANADVAASFQHALERAALAHVRRAVRKTGCRTLCMAGGVALNVKMNKAIWESGLVDDLWVQPAAGDMGNVLGGAWLHHRLTTGSSAEPLRHLYLGPSYDANRVEQDLSRHEFSFHRSRDIAAEVADRLSDGDVVAWFQGRCEFGPRALGARSILADPRSEKNRDLVNLKVKFREPFRPFCPSFREGACADYLENYILSPYMVMSFDVRENKRGLIPAVVHVDGTARPQEVDRVANPPYARLIENFEARAAVPALLNTSMNVRGEPIVNTPEEAIAFFRKTDVDALAIGDFVAVKS